MGLLDSLIGGGVGKLVKDVVGTFKLSPEAKLEFEKEIASREHELALKTMEFEGKIAEYQAKEIQVASENIRAEAANSDKYTSRARPTFMYLAYGILANNYIIVPWIGRNPIEFPEPLFWLMGSCILGYTGARTWEKYAENKFK